MRGGDRCCIVDAMAKVLITGANRGIGLALCRVYQARGDDVLALCRTASPELAEVGSRVRVVDAVDMRDLTALARVRDALEGAPVDVLIHNAGIYASTGLGDLDSGRMAQEYAVNALAPLLWTDGLRDRLRAGSKVVLITSRAGSIAGNVEGGGYGYRMSKAALNMAGAGLARDLAPSGVAVLVLSPGTVLTDMVLTAFERAHVAPSGIPSADEVAPQLVSRIDALELRNSGSFLDRDGAVLPW